MSEIWDGRAPEVPSRIKQPNNHSESEVRRAKPTVTSRRNISISSIFSGLPPFPPPPAAAWRPSRCYAVIGRTPRLPNRARASQQSARQRTTDEEYQDPNRRMSTYKGHRTASGDVRRHSRPLVRRGFVHFVRPGKLRQARFNRRSSAFIGGQYGVLVFASDRRKSTSGRRGAATRWQADAGANHIASALVSICWASFVQNTPRNPTHNVTPAGPASDSGGTAAGRKGHPVQRRRRHNRVHNPKGLRLRSRGAIFGVKMPLRASPPVWRQTVNMDRRDAPTDASGVSREESGCWPEGLFRQPAQVGVGGERHRCR